MSQPSFWTCQAQEVQVQREEPEPSPAFAAGSVAPSFALQVCVPQ